jgi:hypothetical protein
MTDSDTTENEETTSDAGSELTTTEQEVQFINTQVLKPDVTPISGLSKPLVDQAAAMMIQDAQSFLQGNEQMFTIAIAKAAAMVLNPATSETGTAALNAYALFLGKLAVFSTEIGTSATKIASGFKE